MCNCFTSFYTWLMDMGNYNKVEYSDYEKNKKDLASPANKPFIINVESQTEMPSSGNSQFVIDEIPQKDITNGNMEFDWEILKNE